MLRDVDSPLAVHMISTRAKHLGRERYIGSCSCVQYGSVAGVEVPLETVRGDFCDEHFVQAHVDPALEFYGTDGDKDAR